jgi:sugar lactone lactonase YvrE
MNVECIVKNNVRLDGEGPHWDDVTGTLLYVDINGNAIHRYNTETGGDDKLVLGKMTFCSVMEQLFSHQIKGNNRY